VDRLLVPLKGLIPWSLAAGGALIAYQALLGQVALQVDLGAAMSSVATSVREVRILTGQTANALSPLGTVTTSLKGVNADLGAIVQDLQAINGALGGLNQGQTGLAGTVGQLNNNLAAVGQGLADVDKQNRSLLARTEAMAGATGAQAGAVDALSSLTTQSVDALRTINRRLKFLERL
jgi:methyl-accepting chemotaxis protein